MRKISVFNNVSLDGYFVDAQGGMNWAYRNDAEWTAFGAENAKGNGELLFGRVTYEMMASFWPSPAAREANPTVAEGMNRMPKVVFSRKLEKVSWANTRLIRGDLVAEARKLKEESGPDMVILGSGSIVAQLAEANLVDELQLVVVPVVLGKGRTLFEGLKSERQLDLKRTRTFSNGNLVLWYEPKA
jgi:dihydrofolate reductase